MPDLSDSSLVARCIKQDRLAWNEFVERFSPLVFWAIKNSLTRQGYLYNRQDTEDIFQNIFCLLWEKGQLQQIRQRESISGWLAMVAANCALNYFRNKREKLSRKEHLVETIPSDCAVFANANQNQEKLQNLLNEAFKSLSPRELIILKLNYCHEKTHQEIAQLLKTPINTVSSVIKRTKEQLRNKLKKEDINFL